MPHLSAFYGLQGIEKHSPPHTYNCSNNFIVKAHSSTRTCGYMHIFMIFHVFMRRTRNVFAAGFFLCFLFYFFFWFFHSELGNSELHWQTTTTTMRMTLPCYLHWELATGLMWQADSAKNCETLCPRISPLMSFEERRRRSCFWPTTVAFDVLIMREINSFHNVSLVCIN